MNNRLEIWQIVLILVGAGLITLGVFASQLGMSATAGVSFGKVLLVVIGCVFVVLGVLGRNIAKAYQITTVIFVNTLILLILVEVAATVYLRWTSRAENTAIDPRSQYYAEEDLATWAEQMWQEMDDTSFVYTPYLVWRRAPFDGDYINIDAQGHRMTPDADCHTDAFTVFAMGGSTMWGTGVPDWGTIAAYLQVELQTLFPDQSICVINFGESGYNTVQNLIALMLELRRGHVPDLVIVYQGYNDVTAVYQSGDADNHQNLQTFAADIETTTTSDLLWQVLQRTRTARIVRQVREVQSAGTEDFVYFASLGYTLDEAVSVTVADTISSYELLSELADAYSFEFAFFWQPNAYVTANPRVQDYFTVEPERWRWAQYPELFQAVYTEVEVLAQERERLFYIADVFDDVEEQVYIDDVHLLPFANELLAKHMVAALDIEVD